MLGGAAYLFIVNAYFIFMASCVILSALRIPRVQELTDQEWKRLRGLMLRNTLLTLLPAIAALLTLH
ncbi:MAG: hypothetical protein IJV91_04425 [Kiritimatiellae bacterium]|nr:hypothetical protein [Kiritimatiellia bacterium]